MIVLGIETSCDETSIALVADGKEVIANLTTSSLELHKKYGGIVPEIASRHQLEVILPIFAEAVESSGILLQKVDLIAVTQGPGLVGSLMIGIAFAKTLSYALQKPILGVDHLLSHLYAVYLNGNSPQFPYLGVVVSGGHTSMFLLRGFLEFEMIGKTRDDALGEAFDKVAKALNLGFPGGPIIEHRAEKAQAKNISFSTPAIKDSLDFSYSGLKTAVLYYLKNKEKISPEMINEICYGFQESALKALLQQIEKAILKFKVKRLLVGGGVALNKRLREMLKELELEVFLPSPELCTDNAAMVAGLGHQLYNSKVRSRSDFQPYSRFEEKWKLK